MPDTVQINVQGPLPLYVSQVLIAMIGNAWDDAKIVTSNGDALSFVVPGLPATAMGKRAAKKLLGNAEAVDIDTLAQFAGFNEGEDGAYLALTLPEDLMLQLGSIAKTILETGGGPNYMAWSLKDRYSDDITVLSVARSKGQTPDALHKEAKAEVERLRAILEDHGINPDA